MQVFCAILLKKSAPKSSWQQERVLPLPVPLLTSARAACATSSKQDSETPQRE